MRGIRKLGRALLFVTLAAFGAGTLAISEDAVAAPQGHHAKAKHKKTHKRPAKRTAHKKVKRAKHRIKRAHAPRAAHQQPIGS